MAKRAQLGCASLQFEGQFLYSSPHTYLFALADAALLFAFFLSRLMLRFLARLFQFDDTPVDEEVGGAGAVGAGVAVFCFLDGGALSILLSAAGRFCCIAAIDCK